MSQSKTKSIAAAAAAAVIVAVSLSVVTSPAFSQMDPKREAALKDCTAQVKMRVSSRADDQNARVAAFKACMTERGQAP